MNRVYTQAIVDEYARSLHRNEEKLRVAWRIAVAGWAFALGMVAHQLWGWL